MNIRTLAAAHVAALLVLSLAGSGSVWADGGRHYGRHGNGHHGKHQEYQRHHYKGHQGRHITNYYRYEDDHDNEKLLIGLVMGGLIGYAINNAQQGQDYEYERPVPAYGYPAAGGRDPTCLQEREYQTTVIVGGKQVPAYGTACLQPDGSWSRGPALLATH